MIQWTLFIWQQFIKDVQTGNSHSGMSAEDWIQQKTQDVKKKKKWHRKHDLKYKNTT